MRIYPDGSVRIEGSAKRQAPRVVPVLADVSNLVVVLCMDELNVLFFMIVLMIGR